MKLCTKSKTALIVLLSAVLLSAVFVATSASAAQSDLYWSENNKPVFYGAAEITLPICSVDKFDPKDSRFRLFARDFEDGDLEKNIKIQHADSVKTDEVGDYTVSYSVRDTDGNVTKQEVTVHVKSEEETNGKITVRRVMYSTPSDWNMRVAGFTRCNGGDRQILGVYLPDGASFEVKVLSENLSDTAGVSGITFGMLNDDKLRESAVTVSQGATGGNVSEDGFVTVKNTFESGVSGNEVIPSNTDCVPLVTTPILKRGVSIDTTYVYELRFDADSVHKLNYYHAGDGNDGIDFDCPEVFVANWIESGDGHAVIENDVITVVLPIEDLTTKSYRQSFSFSDLDGMLDYYHRVVYFMDEIVGLSYNPKEAIDQNIHIKYLAKADAHGAGAAYYDGSKIAISGVVKETVTEGDNIGKTLIKRGTCFTLLQKNWGGLHEIAHGYQGGLGSGSMGLGEVSNNILGHYVQHNAEIWSDSDNYWLGDSLETTEARYNYYRLREDDPRTFLNMGDLENSPGPGVQLYFLINLFDSFEGWHTYTELFRSYRRMRNACNEAGTTIPNQQDFYVSFFAEHYDVNVMPYFAQWGLEVSDDVKEQAVRSPQSFSILGDIAGDKTDEVMQGEGKTLRYGLVSDSVSEKYGLTGNLRVKLDIDNTNLVEGKTVMLEKSDGVVARAKVSGGIADFGAVYCGGYLVRAPFVAGYNFDTVFCTVDSDREATVLYTAYGNYHSTSLHIRGIYGTDGFVLTLKDRDAGVVHLGGADLGNRSGKWATLTDTVYCSVNIKSPYGVSVYYREVMGNEWFTATKVDDVTLRLGIGYTVEVYRADRSNLINVYSELTGKELAEYRINEASENCTYIYKIGSRGFIPEFVKDFSLDDSLYGALKEKSQSELDSLTEYFRQNSEELAAGYISSARKQQFIEAYDSLREEDRNDYSELYNIILRGGLPILTLSQGKLELTKASPVQWTQYVSATDPEDGVIVLDESNFFVQTDYDGTSAGDYDVVFTVTDSDGNSATATMQLSVQTPAYNSGGSQKGSDIIATVLIWGGATVAAVVAAVVIVLIIKKKT